MQDSELVWACDRVAFSGVFLEWWRVVDQALDGQGGLGAVLCCAVLLAFEYSF